MGQGNKNINRSWMKKKETPSQLTKKIDKLKKPGKTYTKAQLLALKRKAQDKTIAEVKAENEKKMRDRAAARNAAFKAKRKLKINKKKTSDKKKKKTSNKETNLKNLNAIRNLNI
tara:strand:+ start:75 stop:419 length:345 start_codon:yes stop_codon:yes gene_type:complete